MGNKVAVDFSAFNYGYVSPKLRGRVDLDFYNQCLDYLLNYIVTPQGEANYRTGSIFAHHTRGNQVARLVPFLYNTEQAYILEFTAKKMRIFKDHGVTIGNTLTITAVTKANPGVLTYTGTDPTNGQAVYISGIGGMTELEGVEVFVANVNGGANTFELVDINGANINTTAYTTYTTGGTGEVIVEVNTPWPETVLFQLDYTQTNNTMYMSHSDHAPNKITRTSHTAWTVATYDITANPFASAAQAITGITAANPAVVTYGGADTYANGDTVYLSDILGMTQLNGVKGVVANVNAGANTFELAGVNSSAYTAYVSGGFVQEYIAYPSCVTLHEGRLVFGASDSFPTRLWFSKAGELDNLTTGTNAADAMIFTVAADQANRIRWLASAEDYLAFGTSGSEFRVAGGGNNDGLTPTNISVKPSSFNGVAAIRPIRLDSYILYIQRNGKTVRSFEYDALRDGYTSPDRTLLADHIGKSKFKQLSYTAGAPNIIWGVRNDGKLIGLTFDPAQQVVAWHPHNTQGNYLSIGTIPEENDDDELWQVVERTIDGVTKRYVEYTPNVPDIPVFEDYFTGSTNKEGDLSDYLTALWQVQKTLVHADCALIYDGRDLATVDIEVDGVLTQGETVTVIASGAYFNAGMVGKKLQTPAGGQILITIYTDTTHVTGTVLYNLEDSNFDAGEWFFMATAVGGLQHLEGKDVAILADGGVIDGKGVENGQVELDEDAGYVIVGLAYTGIGKLQSLEGGGENGRAQTKPRSLTNLGVRFRASLGTKFGSDLYNMEEPPYRQSGEVAGRPPHLFDGVLPVDIPDTWDENKTLYWLHQKPVPSNIQYIMAHMETND